MKVEGEREREMNGLSEGTGRGEGEGVGFMTVHFPYKKNYDPRTPSLREVSEPFHRFTCTKK